MTFGGEPLLFPEVICAIHSEAARVCIPRREVITNGYLSKNYDETVIIIKELERAGVNTVIISVDAFHQEHIPIDFVRNVARACLFVGIEHIQWDPCWVVSEDNNNRFNEKTRDILKRLEDIPVEITEGNVLEPYGFALHNLKEFLPPRMNIPQGSCGSMPYTDPLDSITCICVEPDGRVAVCNELYIGNANDEDIIELIENYDPYSNPVSEAIVRNGMKGLVRYAESKGIEVNQEGYYSICQMCTDIRKKLH